MVPGDAPGLLAIGQTQHLPCVEVSPGAVGMVAVDGEEVVAFVVMRETALGFVVDDLWPEPSRRGLLGMGMLADWCERIVQEVADARGHAVELGGIVLRKNRSHRRALQGRGYRPVGAVLTKRFEPA